MLNYVILGASAAGLAAAQKLKQINPDCSVVCISSQTENPYNKCLMADLVSGLKDDITFVGSTLLSAKGIQLRLATEIVSINTADHTLTTHTGDKIGYDKLLIATGARAFVPPVAWFRAHPSIVLFHTLSDAHAILDHCSDSSKKKITLVGGGLSGVELADALVVAGHAVTVIEQRTAVLQPLLSSDAAAYVVERMKNAGVQVHCSTSVADCIFTDQDQLKQVVLSDGKIVDTDLLVVVTGQRQNIECAQASGITCSQSGIVVDQFLATSAADVYAAGDCIAVHDQISGLRLGSCTWPDAMFQGALAACAMAGQPRAYPGPFITITSSFFGLKMATTLIAPESQVQTVSCPSGYVELALKQDTMVGYRVLDDSQKKAVTLKRALVAGATGSQVVQLIQSETI